MDVIDDEPRPIAALVEAMTEFVDEIAVEQKDGFAMVERMRIVTPIEFYVRPAGAGGVATLESRTPGRTLTSMAPVLHELSLVVEVDRAEREPSVEP
jgi:hypothetical protein